jgi:hypothetical protein
LALLTLVWHSYGEIDRASTTRWAHETDVPTSVASGWRRDCHHGLAVAEVTIAIAAWVGAAGLVFGMDAVAALERRGFVVGAAFVRVVSREPPAVVR